jgi:hypothetical protein
LTTTGDLSACKSQTNFDTTINRQQRITPRTDHYPKTNKVHIPKASVAHKTSIPGTPRANLRPARGASTALRNSPPRSRALAPQTSFHHARRSRLLERASASLEASLRPRRPAYSPDRGIKCTNTPRPPGSKANPHHADLMSQPWNRIPAPFEQPAAVQPSPTLCGCCAGWSVSLYGTVLPTPILPPHRTPRTRCPSRTTP